MKSENEIKDEIKATNKTIANYRKAYKNGEIHKDILKQQLADCTATLDALKWVLGKNDRYD